MKTWAERPAEIANLFNPAFCAIVLRQSVRGFVQEKGEGLPFALAFLVLPIVLHKRTRELLPKSIATKMHPWIQDHQDVRVGFAGRCCALLPHTQEAIVFAATNDLLAMSANGRIEAPQVPLPSASWPDDSEPAVCISRARFVGRWLSTAGDVATIFAMWGVRP